MSIDFAQADEDLDDLVLARIEEKRDEYRARSTAYSEAGDRLRAFIYQERGNGMDRAIAIYRGALKGFLDTVPTGHQPL